MGVQIAGGCHCGGIRFTLNWPTTLSEMPVRECECSFCRKHGAAWTSHPGANLTIGPVDASKLRRYRFGHKTADFCVCRDCGVAPFVLSEIEGCTYAVVSVHALENVDIADVARRPANFDGEGESDRLDRRARNWIANIAYVT